MKQAKILLTLALLPGAMCRPGTAQQYHPTAARDLQLSAWGAASGVFTGLSGGKNFSVVVGGDLGFRPWHGVRPTAEVRGTYPLDHGLVDSQKSVLGGLRADFLLGRRIHPYGDFLFGRGQMNFQYGYTFGNSVYLVTTTYIDSVGGGVDYDISDNLSIKVDGQVQRWGSAPTASGDVYSTLGTAGLVYRFGFGRRQRP
jgi:hypothetical protein